MITTASLLGDPSFHLSKEDEPFISGHSVSEHLQYCIDKYCPGQSLATARDFYFQHTHREMAEIMEGCGKKGAFTPSHGLKEFLLDYYGVDYDEIKTVRTDESFVEENQERCVVRYGFRRYPQDIN